MKQIQACLSILTIFISISAVFLFPGVGVAQTLEEWIAKVVSVQGDVHARKSGETEWVPVKINDTYCFGDMIRTQERSRAAIVLRNNAILRLDQRTTIIFSGSEKEHTSLIDLITGAVHFFSRVPRGLKVVTPFVNAAVEGTEFFVRVERDKALLSIFEGRVAATNKWGSLVLAKGQSAMVHAGQAPVARVVATLRNAVQWAFYYPPVLDYGPFDFPGGMETDWQAMVRRSIAFYWEGDLARAFSSLKGAPENIRDPRFFTYRAGLLLTVGRLEEASIDIKRAFDLDPGNSHAFALQSIISLVQNEKDRALHLARRAVETAPGSPAPRVALSYAQQANFDLKSALASLQKAVRLDTKNALAWSRVSELWLSLGDLGKAVDAAQKAVALNPDLARTQTVLGFAYLTQIKSQDAIKAFKKAIVLDSAAPLQRLGLGLAKIREGDLKAGRSEIEIAASLDPNNSLIRSYLGKAYFEEKRDKLAKKQFAAAKELDPLDPTAWFYDAIRKQSLNRPVEALQDLQKSIELNDNRAVYRSRLLLDEDLAARSASLARIYDDLGFHQLALVEGWKSLNTDPANHSAHRFLADSYYALPRHEIARVSELLQSQLLQPINVTPVQPQLVETDLLISEGAGLADPSFNEFNPFFLRNSFAFQASGVVGGNDTLGDELVHSGIWGRVSYSLSQFHYETDGFRENNDQDKDIYNAFVQMSLSHKTSIQAEFRYKEIEEGDLPLRFPDMFSTSRRAQEQIRSTRLGFHYAFTPHSDIIGSVIYKNADFDTHPAAGYDFLIDDNGYLAETRHLFKSQRFHVTSGAGHFSADKKMVCNYLTLHPDVEEPDIRHTNFYIYSMINYPKSVFWTVGGSFDFYEGVTADRNQFNPKVGLTWNLFPGTTLRAAGFRVLKRNLISSQTLEPTQVAGFNQFLDDLEGTKSWRYGIGIDQKFSPAVNGGVEFSERETEVPLINPTLGTITKADWDEALVRVYLYWMPRPWLSLSSEYQYERFERKQPGQGGEQCIELKTHRFPFRVNFFHSSGFSTRLKATYIDQGNEFTNLYPMEGDDDQYWLVDGFIRYRLPKRRGFCTIGARNLFDEEFKYQDEDPAKQEIYPERLIFARITLTFDL